MNILQWAISTLRQNCGAFNAGPDFPLRLAELTELAEAYYCKGAMKCQAPGCDYVCLYPPNLSPYDTVICPRHAMPMAPMPMADFTDGLKQTATEARQRMRAMEFELGNLRDQVSDLRYVAWMLRKGAQGAFSRESLAELLEQTEHVDEYGKD